MPRELHYPLSRTREAELTYLRVRSQHKSLDGHLHTGWPSIVLKAIRNHGASSRRIYDQLACGFLVTRAAGKIVLLVLHRRFSRVLRATLQSRDAAGKSPTLPFSAPHAWLLKVAWKPQLCLFMGAFPPVQMYSDKQSLDARGFRGRHLI